MLCIYTCWNVRIGMYSGKGDQCGGKKRVGPH